MHHVELDAHCEVAADPKQGHLSHSDHVQINAYFRALHLTPKRSHDDTFRPRLLVQVILLTKGWFLDCDLCRMHVQSAHTKEGISSMRAPLACLCKSLRLMQKRLGSICAIELHSPRSLL
jgi:hypothetical protein